MQTAEHNTDHLQRTLGPLLLWGLGVGYVISGMYFGWNLGLERGGTLGLAVATFFIILLYLSFTFCYTELACAIPKAGGAFDYAMRAFGRHWGFVGGMAQIIEFVFAPPAIAFAIGAYLNIIFPGIPVLVIAVLAYLVFTALNIYGIQAAASFELVITVVAVLGLLIFCAAAAPAVSWSHLQQNALPNGWSGVFAALPFAVWFFLGIEGVANVAEETIHPQRNVLLGFGSAILTLVVLCIGTFAASVGVGGWETIVYKTPGAAPSDSPLPLALAHTLGETHTLYTAVTIIGVFGLVASFHGILLAAGRATYEFGKVGFAPRVLGRVSHRFKTPANALLLNMAVGIIALFTGKTSEVITIACLGALSLYMISMLALIRLRQREPHLERPFRAPLYPWFPLLAFVLSAVAFSAIAYYNFWPTLLYFALLTVAYGWFRLVRT